MSDEIFLTEDMVPPPPKIPKPPKTKTKVAKSKEPEETTLEPTKRTPISAPMMEGALENEAKAEEEIEPKPKVKEKEAKSSPKAAEPKPDILVAAGKIEERLSVGSPKDSAANKPNSEASPFIDRHYKISPKQFKDGKYCKVKVAYGLTLNLGNYESARLDVEVEDFCVPDKVDDAWKSLKGRATTFINQSARNVREYIAQREGNRAKDATRQEW